MLIDDLQWHLGPRATSARFLSREAAGFLWLVYSLRVTHRVSSPPQTHDSFVESLHTLFSSSYILPVADLTFIPIVVCLFAELDSLISHLSNVNKSEFQHLSEQYHNTSHRRCHIDFSHNNSHHILYIAQPV
jgi:hypothetical protein